MLAYSDNVEKSKLTTLVRENKELDYFFKHAFHDMRFFLEAATSGSDSVFTYFGDLQKQLFYISDNLRDMFGFDHNVVQNFLVKWSKRIYGDKWVELYVRDLRNLKLTKSDTHNLRYQVKDAKGNVFWIHCHGSVLWNEDKTKPLFFAGRIVKQGDEFAVDPVTNFPIGMVLKDRLIKLKKYEYSCLTLGIALNHISQINLMYGRNVGDKIIRKIAKCFNEKLVGKMTFYSLTSTKFIALVDNDVSETKETLIRDIRKRIAKIYESEGIVVDRVCFFSVMNFNTEVDDPDKFVGDMNALIRYSMNQPTLEYIDNSLEHLTKIRENANMNLALNRDVLNNMANFRLVVQPIVDTKSEKIKAGEVLLRWRYKSKDIPPSVFIGLMEKERLISIAGRWIMENAIKLCSEIVKYHPDFYLNINISRRQLYDENLFLAIPEILNRYQLSGSNLVFEITESTIDKEPKRTNQLVGICNYFGIRLAIDDFGTGYSSFQSLMHYRYDILKIDRSLLLEIEKSEHNLIFVSGLVNACRKNNIKICMEGVETDNQKAIASNIDCDLIQGFYYYRPLDIDKLLLIMTKGSK